MTNKDFVELATRLRRFSADRDWEQFHSPKNLAMALSVEAGEIVEQFQWLTEQQSRELSKPDVEKIEQELADVLIYLVRLSDELGIDLIDAAFKKMAINEERYPADQVRGSARKYTDYQ